ncbi:MAG: CoA activase [Verrucomicrobia bacterium]|nr:CoA activase [Verrucomicrobiota bacterium]
MLASIHPGRPDGRPRRPARFLGLDVGAETIKLVELARDSSGGSLHSVRRLHVEHHKDPAPLLRQLLQEWDWAGVAAAAGCGRFSRQLDLPRVPVQQAQARAWRFLGDDQPVTLVSIGSHGFSVLELRGPDLEVFRENSRCSQGTGNFLRQLVERFSLSLEEANALAAAVHSPAALSGRCPVILKSDMTHLANKGEDRARILAGLFDAVCENVLNLIKPGLSPRRVALLGGVSRSARVQASVRAFLDRHEMELLTLADGDALFLEATGCALVAAETVEGAELRCSLGSSAHIAPGHEPLDAASPAPSPASAPHFALPPLERVFVPAPPVRLEKVPALAAALARVKRLPAPPPAVIPPGEARPLLLGFDIGSTGSKAVALEPSSGAMVWQGYRPTFGDPVGAAQALVQSFLAGPAAHCPVTALGTTGSGRDIVGSLLATCYGRNAVFILNEIAAHAAGALSCDPRVDTIFEIGGQDAKYIRLAEGRVIDCAMNEACSAGTGSFIEEQGRKFSGIRDVVHFGCEALAATGGVSLGQHCSVFMAEVIDEAVASGVEQRAIIAGLYDSIIQNYLHRVKGNRSVGQVIFCQGMPFAADALAAAVARQTGSEVIIPPHPGTVGALGIALLTAREIPEASRSPLDLGRFLAARVAAKDNFLCKATTGCGGSGNRCRIERLRTIVEARQQSFTWGGGCALHDKGTRKKKLPDLAPDPFREREELLRQLLAGTSHREKASFQRENRPASPDFAGPTGREFHSAGSEIPGLAARPISRGRPRVALSDEFMLKGLLPFVATFLHELGVDLVVVPAGDHAALKRGIQEANVPFCAPMQQFHGLASRMAETDADYLFLPMVRSLPRVNGEPYAVTCPVVQASPDLLRWDLQRTLAGRVLSPILDFDEANLESQKILDACAQLAAQLHAPDWRAAHRLAVAAQEKFEHDSLALGRRALEFCAQQGIVPVVVVGRPYTIYNTVLNSNVPAILREQGAIAIPLDCLPVDPAVPAFDDMFWSHGQRILRAAHQIRRMPGVYGLYCSNYSCGPDSFNLHFYAYIMEGKPFAFIETDGHSGDAGTKTRVEAFLHCVAQDLAADSRAPAPHDFRDVQYRPSRVVEVRDRGETLLIPSMGPSSEVLARCFRSVDIPAENLPPANGEALRCGRRHTSGKECLPLVLTLGNLLQRLERERDTAKKFALLFPTAHGPCREGVYNLLTQITLERLGWTGRVRLWAPTDHGYFEDLPGGLSLLIFSSFIASDLLLDARHLVEPVETRPGAAREIYTRHFERLLNLIEHTGRHLSAPHAAWQFLGGDLFGLKQLLADAAAEFAAIRGPQEIPTVLVVGEIYVRCEPFANDFVIEKLQQRGLRARLAPFHEWLDYSDFTRRLEADTGVSLSSWFGGQVQRRVQHALQRCVCRSLEQPEPPSLPAVLATAQRYVSPQLFGESHLTIGSPLEAWRRGTIDAVVSVGPLECMPNKIAESQFFHAAEHDRLLSLTLPFNGEHLDAEALDNFAFEVHARFRQRHDPAEFRPSPARAPSHPAGLASRLTP